MQCYRIKETCIPEFSEPPDCEDDQPPDSFLNHAFSSSEQPPFEVLHGDAHFMGHLVCRNSLYLSNIDIHPLDVCFFWFRRVWFGWLWLLLDLLDIGSVDKHGATTVVWLLLVAAVSAVAFHIYHPSVEF